MMMKKLKFINSRWYSKAIVAIFRQWTNLNSHSIIFSSRIAALQLMLLSLIKPSTLCLSHQFKLSNTVLPLARDHLIRKINKSTVKVHLMSDNLLKLLRLRPRYKLHGHIQHLLKNRRRWMDNWWDSTFNICLSMELVWKLREWSNSGLFTKARHINVLLQILCLEQHSGCVYHRFLRLMDRKANKVNGVKLQTLQLVILWLLI